VKQHNLTSLGCRHSDGALSAGCRHSDGALSAFAILFALTLLGSLVGGQPATAAPAPAEGGWWADYFDTPTLSGAPILSRTDS